MRIASYLIPVLALTAVTARADLYFTSYSFNLTGFPKPVTNIIAAEYEQSGASVANRMNFLAEGSGNAAANSITPAGQPFSHFTPVTSMMLIGITQDLPGDPLGQKHIVLMVNPAITAGLVGVPWQPLFPTLLEEDLIADLELATSGGLNWGNPYDTLAPGLNSLQSFLENLRVNGFPGTAPPNVLYPWFAAPAPGSPAVDFDLVAFSTGQQIGSGQAFQAALVTGVPEPSAAWVLMGAAAIVARCRRR
ncbi:hypothetical protein F183_A34090 [Bryobacterales bacterium F-183]|nr:hypothetical protein F183_A34090 [Bryobacterales bacterium F-183]